MPFGIASAVVYGTSIVFQHRTAQEHADGGQASATGLLSMLRRPVFLLAIGGDSVGFLLQLVALSTGPVVVIQPLVVLMLPVSIGVTFLCGGRRPSVGDYLGVLGVLGGLTVFLALIGQPGVGHIPRPRVLGLAVLLVLLSALVLVLVVAGRNRVVRAATYGAVAGGCFGTLAVMVAAAAAWASRAGYEGVFESPRGLIPLAGIVVLGVAGMTLTQLSFQIGALGATLPANLAADPVVGVLLGVLLLHEQVPLSAGHLAGYLVCLVAVVAGAIRLANPADEPSPTRP
ncbi:MAG: DMT family transporter [Jatrophihabitans sp.]